jgi:hypothetical protein
MISDWSGIGAQNGNSLGLTGLASLGFVLELFIVEEKLLPGCENEVGAAIDTLQNLILEFHGNAPFGPRPQHASNVELSACRRRSRSTPLCVIPGFGPPCAGRHMDNFATAFDN